MARKVIKAMWLPCAWGFWFLTWIDDSLRSIAWGLISGAMLLVWAVPRLLKPSDAKPTTAPQTGEVPLANGAEASA